MVYYFPTNLQSLLSTQKVHFPSNNIIFSCHLRKKFFSAHKSQKRWKFFCILECHFEKKRAICGYVYIFFSEIFFGESFFFLSRRRKSNKLLAPSTKNVSGIEAKKRTAQMNGVEMGGTSQHVSTV